MVLMGIEYRSSCLIFNSLVSEHLPISMSLNFLLIEYRSTVPLPQTLVVTLALCVLLARTNATMVRVSIKTGLISVCMDVKFGALEIILPSCSIARAEGDLYQPVGYHGKGDWI